MFSKKLTSISIATVAALGAMAMSVESASAKSGIHVHVGFGGGHHWGYRPWRHRHWGVYSTPVVYSAMPECFYVRRYGRLFKVCE